MRKSRFTESQIVVPRTEGEASVALSDCGNTSVCSNAATESLAKKANTSVVQIDRRKDCPAVQSNYGEDWRPTRT